MTEFLPRVPFVTAEHHVNYSELLSHIDSRRATVEAAVAPTARKLAYVIVTLDVYPASLISEITVLLETVLMQTARLGYRHARAELVSLRKRDPVPVTAAYHVPDAGQHGQIARGGLDAIQKLIRRRSHDTAAAVYAAAHTTEASADTEQPIAVRVAAAATAATRVLHAHVLELVGETLNLGRTAGIFSIARPPEFAMRSEQLDANTCDECDQLHGTIVQIDSQEYFDLMPPSLCLGGGRCRGIYVYGDSADEVEQQQAA